jgi:CheY-like chemotaxis protein
LVASARLILSIKSTKTPITGKILIVEDNLDLLSLLHRVLRAEGYDWAGRRSSLI